MFTATLSIYDLYNFEKKVEELNRKAKRLHVEPITYTVGQRTVVEVVTGSGLWENIHKVPMYEVVVHYPELRISGWTMVGKINHAENVVTAAKGQTMPEGYHDSQPTCDHCGKVRSRNATYLMASDAGEYKRVGRSCLGYFLGIDADEAMALSDWYFLMADLLGEDSDREAVEAGVGGYSLPIYLAYVARAIREHGWMSRTVAADTGRTASADRAMSQMIYVAKLTDRDEIEENRPAECDVTTAAAAIAWATQIDPGNDYERNVLNVAQNGFCTKDTYGLAASIVNGYLKANQPKAPKTSGVFLGQIGSKIEITATLKFVGAPVYTEWGPAYFNVFESDGSQIVWKTHGQVDEGTYKIKATVKEHREYKGVQQTIITRPKLEMVA